jgi:uncharacterized membrane protein
VLTGAGWLLTNLLLNQGLASEISLIIYPIIVAINYSILSSISEAINLKLDRTEVLGKRYVWLVCTINKLIFPRKMEMLRDKQKLNIADVIRYVHALFALRILLQRNRNAAF